MKKIYTLILAFACFATMQVKAQINDASPFPVNFVIEQPASIAATYDYGTQTEEWGPQLNQDVRGVIAWGFGESADADGNAIPGTRDSLGCRPLTNGADLKNKMVMIRRGLCNFSLKVYNAQQAGAAGVIIANHYDDPANDAQTVVGMLGGDSLAAVTVPAVFLSRTTVELIAAEVDAGNEVIGLFEIQNLYDQFGPYAYYTPQSQIIPLDEIQVNFFNDDDSLTVTTTVTVDITDPAGTVTSYSETVDVGPVGDSTIQFPDYVPVEKGAYSIVYKNDFNSDELRQDFEITDYTFGVDAGPDANGEYGWISPGDQGFIDDGSKYDFGSTFIAGADGMATHITFGLNNPDLLFTGNPTADVFTVVLYDVDPTGTTPLTGQEDSYDSFGLLEFGGYTLTGNEQPGELIDVEFFAPVALEEGKVYLAVVQYDGNNAGIGIAPQYITSGEINYPYFGSMVFTDRLYTGGWASNTNGVIRLQMEGFTTGTKEPRLDASKVNVFPTPARENVNLELNLAEMADQVEIKMVDLSAKILRTYKYENVKERTFEFDVNDLANGTYFLHIRTPEGVRAQKFTVIK